MSGGRAAPLDGSLLARKGDAAPAITDESPLVVNLDDRRDGDAGSTETVEVAPQLVAAAPFGGTDISSAAEPAQSDRFSLTPNWLRWAAIAIVVVVAVSVLWLLRSSGETTTGTAESSEVREPAAPEVSVAENQKLQLNLNTVAEPPASAAPTEADGAPPNTAQTLPAAAALAGAVDDAPATPSENIAPTSGTIIPVRLPEDEVLPDTEEDDTAPKLPTDVPKSVSPVPVPKAKPVLESGSYGVQFASIPIEQNAQQEAFRLQKLLAPVLGAREIRVERAVVDGKGTTYRLRTDGFESNTEARAACARVAEFKVNCIAYRR